MATPCLLLLSKVSDVLARPSRAQQYRAFVRLERLDDLNIHPSMRLRIDHWREHRPQPYIG